MSELQTTKDIRTEGDLSEGDIGYGGAYSGVGKTKGTQPKVITINIQSLIGSVNINSTNGGRYGNPQGQSDTSTHRRNKGF